MAYLGNDLNVAYPSYKNIDDISGSFNGVTTSFALLVGGVAPSPLPLNSQQCLISVGGVVQRPDDTGAEGFRLSGGNIVFSSAPGTGEDFFGVILAGADYVNVGANFPSGSAAVPSITFDSDLDTGIYNSGANQVSVATAGTARLTVNSSGNVGINTTSPGSALQVNGTGGIRINEDGVGTKLVQLRSDYASAGPAINVFTNHPLLFLTNDTERARIDSSGRLLVGTSTAETWYASLAQIQYNGSEASFMAIRNSANTEGGGLYLGKSRGTTPNSATVVQSGDSLGAINFLGADGTDVQTIGAQIKAEVDGTPGVNDMPGRLVFSTTADGASSPTERMRITQTGHLKCSNSGIFRNTTGAYHEIRQSVGGDNALWIDHTASSGGLGGISINYTGQTPNNTGNSFIACADSTALRFDLRSNGGIANYSGNNVNLSDINSKKDISPAAGTWNCIKEWEIVNYRYKDQPDDADLNLGVIAQQVAESCPEVITVFQEAKEAKPAVFDEEGNEIEPAQEAQPEKLGVKEQQMYWMAIKALQEAQVRIEALEAEVAALKAA